uniref:Wsv192-like protein n=1 Tax=Penaeus semisulcatus majanivirus TaxID=2984274 RepID=A0A9C7F083_9VIRU|nr:MAG: wsv192-like protein [Penaeus semisulcatus majanivirus]
MEITWNDIDESIEHYMTHNRFSTNILYNERQQVTLITMMNYLNEHYQSCFDCDKNVDREIIIRSIRRYNRTILKRILTLAKEHADLLVKEKKFCSGNENCCFDNIKINGNNNNNNTEANGNNNTTTATATTTKINNIRDLMCDRFLEHTDPEMEIWRRLQEEGCVNRDIEAEMRRVQHLLPKRVPIYNNKRSGLATISRPRFGVTKSDEGGPFSGNWNTEDFVARVYCDDISIESNEISKLFCKSLVYDRSRRIKIPQYLRSLHVQCIDRKCFPNNCFKLLVMLYNLFSPIFGSYMAIQCFISSIKKSLTLAVKTKKTIVQATSSLESSQRKTASKMSSTSSLSGRIERLDLFGRITSSSIRQPPQQQDDVNPLLLQLENTATVILQKNEKDILFLLCGKIAEMDTDHPYLQLLTSCFYHALNRRKKASIQREGEVVKEEEEDEREEITPNYILILLLNYIYKKSANPIRHKCLSILGSRIGLCTKNGILVPLCGIGSGITERKLRRFACRSVEIIKNNYMDNTSVAVTTKNDDEKETIINNDEKNIDYVVDTFFDGLSISEPNEIEKNSIDDSTDGDSSDDIENEHDNDNDEDERDDCTTFKCECSCHIVEDIKGKTLHPCKRRREIKEEVYEKSLNLKPSLSLTFGVCGFKHLLNNVANMKVDRLVKRQKLKERRTFIERESASKTNWYNLIHYLFVENGNGKTALLNMCRTRVRRISEFVVQCDYFSDVLRNLEFKFNSSLLPLGYKENVFMKLKSGSDIVSHATDCWRQICLHRGWIEDIISGKPPPDWTIDYARRCYNEHDAMCDEMEKNKPFVRRSQCPFPYRNVEPVIETEAFYKSKTFEDSAVTSYAFWAECTYETLVDALRMKKIISENNKHLAGLESLVLRSGDPSLFESLIMEMKNKYDHEASNTREKNDISRWSRKNSGIHGKRSIDFDANSLMVIEDRLFDGRSCFFFLVESQDAVIKKNVEFISIGKPQAGNMSFIKAPCISPLYKTNIKPIPITVKSKP